MWNTGEAAATGSNLARFIQALAAEGRAVVGAGPFDRGDDDARPLLAEWHSQAAAELALDPPGYSAEAALWAARLLYQLSQFTVCRDIGEDQIAAACREPCPSPRGPETDWSADLLLRHLPALFQLARHLSQTDPLIERMKEIATAWPLSSVGIPGLAGFRLDTFIAHPALCRLYLDRITATRDVSRTGDSRIDDLLRADLGMRAELCPDLAATLSKSSP